MHQGNYFFIICLVFVICNLKETLDKILSFWPLWSSEKSHLRNLRFAITALILSCISHSVRKKWLQDTKECGDCCKYPKISDFLVGRRLHKSLAFLEASISRKYFWFITFFPAKCYLSYILSKSLRVFSECNIVKAVEGLGTI